MTTTDCVNTTQAEQFLKVADSVIQFAKQQGATQTAVAIDGNQGLSTTVRLGEVETVEFNRDKGVGVTVYFGQSKGSASCTDLSEESLKATVQAACEIAKITGEDKCFGLAEAELFSDDIPQLALFHPWSVDAAQAIELGKVCEEKALGIDKRLVNSEGVSVGSYEFLRTYANSHGFVGQYQATRHSMSCVLVAEDEKGLQRNYEYTTARDANNLESTEWIAERAAERTLARLNAQRLPTQKAPVLFSNEVSSSLIGSLISAISGGSLYRKASFMLDSLGKQCMPERYSIYEQPHVLGALGSAPFDSEGLITRPNVFIKNGTVERYIMGSYSARRLGLQTTANAGGVHGLTVDHDGLSFDDLLAKMGTGLLVTEMMGQGTNIVTGDYSRGASGFWVEQGKIQYPVDEITIAGQLAEMLQGIEGIANDIETRKASNIGSILVNEMMIGGESA